MTSKQQHEHKVFVEFAQVAGLAVDSFSIVACDPPEPDIRCIVGNQPTYFELGRLLDNGMQKQRLLAMRQAPTPVTLNPSAVQLPERGMLTAKLKKKYTCSGNPVELILYYDNEEYYDNEDWLRGDVPVWGDEYFPQHAEHVMVPIVTAHPKLFSRIWVFERHRPSVLWSYAP